MGGVVPVVDAGRFNGAVIDLITETPPTASRDGPVTRFNGAVIDLITETACASASASARSLLQWGRDRSDHGNLESAERNRDTEVRFNGAVIDLITETGWRPISWRCSSRLQWGRDRSDHGNLLDFATQSGLVGELQWGRDRSDHGNSSIDASATSSSLLQWGRDRSDHGNQRLSALEQREAVVASMGP